MCDAATDDDDEVIQQEFGGHSDLDAQRRKAKQRMRLPRPVSTYDPADPIKVELERRATFQRNYQTRLDGIMAGAKGRLTPAVQRKLDQLASQVAYEEVRRRRFDKEWPDIYRSPEEKKAAYAALNPNTWSDRCNC